MMRVIFRAPILGTSGYAALSRKWLNGLVAIHDRSQIDLVVEPFIWHNDTYIPPHTKQILERFAKQTAAKKDQIDLSEAVLLNVSLPFEYADVRLSGGFPVDGYGASLGYTMLETDRVTPPWAVCCNWMDVICVPTEFNVETFTKSGVTSPVLAIPPGVDFNCDGGHPSEFIIEALKGAEQKAFNFLTVGQWSPPLGQSRKNFEGAIQSFCVAFEGRKDVGLIIKTCCSLPSESDHALCVQKIKSAKLGSGLPLEHCPSVFLIYGTLTEGDVDYLYHKSHAFLLPTHGEGWGINIIQAITHKLPVISTNWSSIPHIVDTNLGWFLRPELKPVAPTIAHYSRQAITSDHLWAEVSSEALVNALIEVEANPDEVAVRVDSQLQHLRNNSTSWVTSAERLVNACVEAKRHKTKIITLSNIKTKKVLVVMPMSFGDVHLLTSLLPQMSKNLEGAQIDVMTKRRNFGLLEGNTHVGNLLPYPDFWYEPLWRCRFEEMPISKRLGEKYDPIYLPYHTTQIDFHKAPSWFEEGVHFLELYADACNVSRDKIGRPVLRDEMTNLVRDLPDAACVLHPWAPDPAKRWSRFQGLADYLMAEGWKVVQVGGPGDPLLKNVADARGLSFYELAAVFHYKASVFVGTDSFCGHVASGAGTPTVSIFGGTVSSFSHPYWPPNIVLEPKYPVNGCERGCHLFECKYGEEKRCIDLVSIAEAREAVRKLTGR